MTKTQWVVRRSETGRSPYKTILETDDKDTAVAEYRALCYRDLACDPTLETKDVEARTPHVGSWGSQWSFQYPYRNGPKTRLFKRQVTL